MFRWICLFLTTLPIAAQPEYDDLLAHLSWESAQRAGEIESPFEFEKNSWGFLSSITGYLTDPGEFEANAMEFLEMYAPMFGLGETPFEQLEAHRTWDREQDILPFVNFSQHVEGIPVHLGLLSVNGDQQGRVFDIYNSLKPIHLIAEQDLELHPTISEDQVYESLANAAQVPHTMVAIEEEVTTGESLLDELQITPLVLYLYYDAPAKRWHLAYRTDFGHLETLSRYFIDAHTGNVLEVAPLVYSLGHTQGSGTDSHNQNQNIHVWQWHASQAPIPAGNFKVEKANDAQNLYNQYVKNAANGLANNTFISLDAGTPQTGKIFAVTLSGNRGYFGTSPSSNLDGLQASHVSKAYVDNLANIKKSMDFFSATYQWQGFDNQGSDILAFTRTGQNGNAGFAPTVGYMLTGAGGWIRGKQVKHLGSAMDIVAHEFAHGVSHYRTPKGLPYINETGAINEHISDLYGILIQAKYDRLDWKLGERANFEIRDIEDPHLHKKPAALGGDYYFAPMRHTHVGNDYGGVHHNSSIPNHALYLMATGGTHNGRSFPAFDADPKKALEKIGQLYFHAMPAMMPDINFLKLYRILKNTAMKLYASDPNFYDYLNSINGAWGSVGMKGGQFLNGSIGDAEPNNTPFQANASGDSLMNIKAYGALSHNMPISPLDTDVYNFTNTMGKTPFVADLKMDNSRTRFDVRLYQHVNGSLQLVSLQDFRSQQGGLLAVIDNGHYSLEIKQLNGETSTYSLNLRFAQYTGKYGDLTGVLMTHDNYLSEVSFEQGQLQGRKSIFYVEDYTKPLGFGALARVDARTNVNPWRSGKLRLRFQKMGSTTISTVDLENKRGQQINVTSNGYYFYWLEKHTLDLTTPNAKIYYGLISGGGVSPLP